MSESATFSFRVRNPYADALERVAESEGELRSSVCRRAVKFYLEENPDELEVLQ